MDDTSTCYVSYLLSVTQMMTTTAGNATCQAFVSYSAAPVTSCQTLVSDSAASVTTCQALVSIPLAHHDTSVRPWVAQDASPGDALVHAILLFSRRTAYFRRRHRRRRLFVLESLSSAKRRDIIVSTVQFGTAFPKKPGAIGDIVARRLRALKEGSST